MTKQRLQICGMHCVGCAMTIDGALEDLAGVQSANTSYVRQWVDIQYDERKLTEQQIIDAIRSAGYEVILQR